MSKYKLLKYKINPFSLVELLIVISVLAILVSLVSPSLKRVLEISESMNCSKNLQSLSVGATLYQEDNNQIVLPLAQGVGQGISFRNWTHPLREMYIDAPHNKEGNILFCPSEYDSPSTNKYSNYSMLIYNGCDARADEKYKQVSLNNISRPQDAIFLLDNLYYVHRLDYYRNFQNKAHILRHNGGQNRLYIDGHVQRGIANLDLPQGYWWSWAIGNGH